MIDLLAFEMEDIQAAFATANIGTPNTEYDEETGTYIYVDLERPSNEVLLTLADRIAQIVTRHEARQVIASVRAATRDAIVKGRDVADAATGGPQPCRPSEISQANASEN